MGSPKQTIKNSKALQFAVFAIITAFSCVSCVTKNDSNGGLFSGMFGGDKKPPPEEETESPEPAEPDTPIPTKLPVGSIQSVMADEKFVLIRSSRSLKLKPGTEMMTYNGAGRPTSKLSLSPEKKGAFVVADIVQGSPGKGDRVVAMGLYDLSGRTTGGLVPAEAPEDSDEIQVLE